MDPRQEAQLKKYLEWIEKEGDVEGPTHFTTLAQPRQQARIAWLKENAVGRILEVGCNMGYVLARVGGHVGVDINPANIALATILATELEFHVADAEQLPFGNKSFTTVLLPEVLEHLEHVLTFPADLRNYKEVGVPRAIAEALRVATHRVLITCPDGRTDSDIATNFKHSYLVDGGHLEHFKHYLWPHKTNVMFQDGFVLIRCDLEEYKEGKQ